MAAPAILQSDFLHTGLAGSVQLTLTNIQAGNSVVVMGGVVNASAAMLPATIGEDVGDYTLAPRVSYEDGVSRKLGIYVWDELDVPATGSRTFTLTLSNNGFPWLFVAEIEPAVFVDFDEDDRALAATGHGHSASGVTTASESLFFLFIGSPGNADFDDMSLPDDPYTRRTSSGDYERRYAMHHGANDVTADNLVITSQIGQVSHAVSAWYVGAAAGPEPIQDVPTGSFSIIDGATGTIRDVAPDWSVGIGGTGPLTFADVSLAAGFSITSTGQIQSDGTPAVGSWPGQQYQADDAANNGPTLSNLFTITVDPATAGVLTTPPLYDETGVAVTGRTQITIAVYPAETPSATPTVVIAGEFQEPDGTIVVSDPLIITGETYIAHVFEPKPNAADAYFGIFRLTAT